MQFVVTKIEIGATSDGTGYRIERASHPASQGKDHPAWLTCQHVTLRGEERHDVIVPDDETTNWMSMWVEQGKAWLHRNGTDPEQLLPRCVREGVKLSSLAGRLLHHEHDPLDEVLALTQARAPAPGR